MKIGILAYHGDIAEHASALSSAFKNLKITSEIILVRTKKDIQNLDALIIPGGESTVMHLLSEREGIFESIKKIKNIFGTCAGAIMLAKKILHNSPGQKTLELMDIEVDRNAYGRQTSSFEKKIESKLGNLNAVFIRAPKITKVAEKINIIAGDEGNILACEQKQKDRFYLAACFHPELTTSIFHEYFIKNMCNI